MRFGELPASTDVSGAVLKTRLLTKNYGRIAALRECTLDVNGGEVFGLLGPNGAGKTTLLRLLLGFLRPTSGQASLLGFDCERQSVRVRRNVAYLPAEAALFPQMRGREVLRFFSHIRHRTDLARSLAIADRLELDVNRKVSLMSTGMKHKLALAATLAAGTAMYILDEPTANLDPTVRSTVLALVHEAKQAGKTILFSSHVLSEVEEACDRVAILRNGRVVHEQAIAPLREQHRIVARLNGELPPIPEALRDRLVIDEQSASTVVFLAPGELAAPLNWVSTLALADLRIEHVGLRSIYDRFHAEPRRGSLPTHS